MKDTYRCEAFFLVFAIAFAIVAPLASAQNPFDGTWHVDKLQVAGSMVLLVQDGVFDCKNVPLCDPEIRVKADGTDQPVSGHQFDAIIVREISPASMKMTMKKDGKVVREDEDTLSDDGNTSTGKSTVYRLNNTGYTGEAILKRVGPAPAGADKISGTWRVNVTQTGSDLVVFTLKSNGDGMDYKSGSSWSAKFDGRDYPVTGPNANDTISLKRIGGHSFEETIKRDGAVSAQNTFTVSDDGTTMNVVSKNPKSGATETYFAHKQ